MANSNNTHGWLKQGAPQFSGAKYLNDFDLANPAGIIQSVPSGVAATQGMQNIVGDTFFFSEDQALALSDTAIGTLYGGFYKLVQTKLASTAAPAVGKACFWDTGVAADLMQVTPDESGSQGVNLFAGVYINALTKGNYGFVQVGGKCTIRYRTTFSGVAANGQAVFLAGAGAGTDVGTFDVFGSDGAAVTFAQAAQLVHRFVGTAEALPVAAALGIVSFKNIISYHW